MKLRALIVLMTFALIFSSPVFAYDNQNSLIGKNMRENARESGQELEHLNVIDIFNPMNWFQQKEEAEETVQEDYYY